MSTPSPKETESTEIQERILELLAWEKSALQSKSYQDDQVDEPCRLCEELLQALQQVKTASNDSTNDAKNKIPSKDPNFIRTSLSCYNNKSPSGVSVRDVLGNLQSDTLLELAALLLELMSSRVDLHDLLPATQDERANEEAMCQTPITLTKTAFVAAQLYVELVDMPGAWGAGLVDVGALGALSALLRRWSVECRGSNPPEPQGKRDERYKRKCSNRLNQPHIKRSRKANVRRSVVLDISEDEASVVGSDHEGADSFVVQDEEASNASLLTRRDLTLCGLKIAKALATIPLHKDFILWSYESREALIDAAAISLFTAAALMGSKKHPVDMTVASCGKMAIDSLSHALANCLSVRRVVVDARGTPSTNGVGNRTKEIHETSIFILRGLLPCLLMQFELPHGEEGREAGHRVAVSSLLGLIDAVSRDSVSLRIQGSSAATPGPRSRNTPSNTVDATTPMTGRKGRRKRVSFGILDDSFHEQTTPTLKGSNTPARRRSQLSEGLTPVQVIGRPRPILSAIVGFIQKLATSKGLERSNTRNATVEVLRMCLPRIPLLERSCLLRFLIQLCHSKVSVHRLTATEVIAGILPEIWLWTEHASYQASVNGPDRALETPVSTRRASFSPIMDRSTENMPLALLQALHGRLLDRTPSVRARTAYCFSEMLHKVSSLEIDSEMGDDLVKPFTTALDSIYDEVVMNLRKRATVDERATVRKAAVNAIVEVLTFGDNARSRITGMEISMLSVLCRDDSVATRKAAAEALSTLLHKSLSATHEEATETTKALERAWACSVLPLVLDMEPTIVGKAIDLFVQVVIEPLLNEKRSLASDMSCWRILAHLLELSRQQGATQGELRALKVVLRKLEETYEEEIFRQLVIEVRVVASNVFVDRNISELKFDMEDNLRVQGLGVFCLLDALTDQEKELQSLTKLIKRNRTFDLDFLVKSWKTMHSLFQISAEDTGDPTMYLLMQSCMRVLGKVSQYLPASEAEFLMADIKSLLSSFLLPSDSIGSAVSSLVAFTLSMHVQSTEAVAKRACTDWITDIYHCCQAEIAAFVSGPPPPLEPCESKLARLLFTVGELSLVGFCADEPSHSRILQAHQDQKDTISGLYVRPPNNLLRLVQSILSKHLPGDKVIRTPEPARAHAFVTLGKLCLRDENLARSCLNILARELHQNMTEKCAPVQSNALLVLGDLCVKYTNLVDRYLPVMAACLQSGSSGSESFPLFDPAYESTALVRKHAVLILSSLLLQDYIKWRGLLVHRFLVASADDDEGVATLAEMSLTGPLLAKYPKLFFNNFVESLFVLNRCRAHPVYNAAAAFGDIGAGITVGFDGIDLSGQNGRVKRLRIYKMMLARMSDEEKLGITARIAKDVLGAATESGGDLANVCRNAHGSATESGGNDTNESALNVLSDAFTVLTSPSLRVGSRTNAEDEPDSALDGRTIHVAAAKGKLLSKISRKHLISIVLPILCKLKGLLQASCSPLLKELMRYLVEIFRHYKSEVKEVLANDPTLLQEVEYDARQFQKAGRLDTPTNESIAVS